MSHDRAEALADQVMQLRGELERLSLKCAALAKLVYPVHPDPTGKTREPPHCPTCSCGTHADPA